MLYDADSLQVEQGCRKGCKNLGFRGFYVKIKKTRKFKFKVFKGFLKKNFKIQILDSQSQQKIVTFQLCLFMLLSAGGSCIIYEIFFVNFWVINCKIKHFTEREFSGIFSLAGRGEFCVFKTGIPRGPGHNFVSKFYKKCIYTRRRITSSTKLFCQRWK